MLQQHFLTLLDRSHTESKGLAVCKAPQISQTEVSCTSDSGIKVYRIKDIRINKDRSLCMAFQDNSNVQVQLFNEC